MSEHTDDGPRRAGALSFGRVADEYDRARPSYPEEAVRWLVGGTTGRVLELGAGTGKLTERLLDLGLRVTATDPSAPMLHRLRSRLPAAVAVLGAAESIPVASGSVDVVAGGQAFHWFDAERALPETARVLRPGGVLALVWNERDERIPWVRRLGALIGTQEQEVDPRPAIDGSGLFGDVETRTFRFWQPLTRDSLRDLVASRSNIAVMTDAERRRVLGRVDALYEEYGRGADGMLLPYVTRCFRAPVRRQPPRRGPGAPAAPDELGTDALLIDFR